MSQQVLSITQINEYVRSLMDQDGLLCSVAVHGEISNYKLYPSGHHYFTLKDENASLKCVMFRGNAAHLRFRPENGMKVIAMGKISVYPRDGAYQLYCSNIVMDGIGDLHAAFEQLKKKLSSQGLFDPEHKKQLPKFPNRIAIITSSAGAAVHDMLRILKKRYPLTQAYLLPVRVQGAEAPAEIVDAIRYANHFKLADLLIVGRGGGSIEDLWAFNDEAVAHAIYDSEIPVISAVGHEPDVTISDYVADLRAATPSNAAELAVPDMQALYQTLDSLQSAMNSSVIRRLQACRQHLRSVSIHSALKSATRYLEQRRDALSLITVRLYTTQQKCFSNSKSNFISLTAKLDAMSPLKVLERGYSLTQSSDGKIIRSTNQIHTGETVDIRINDGVISATVIDVKENSYES